MAADFMRIGDAERDDAVAMLQEHHVSGRLSAQEFDDRMSRALSARTQSDLDELFRDLPGPRPGVPTTAHSPNPFGGEVTTSTATPYFGYDSTPEPHNSLASTDATPGAPSPKLTRPWYAQWWLVIVAVLIASATDLGILVVVTALWVWAIYPSMVAGRRSVTQRPAAPPRPLTYSEREYVMDEVRAGHQINAIKRYRELTGADLLTAKNAVEAWSRQIGR